MKLMKRKREDHDGLASYTKEKEPEMWSSKFEGVRRKDGAMEEFNEMA